MLSLLNRVNTTVFVQLGWRLVSIWVLFKTKTKVLTLANHNMVWETNSPIRSQSKSSVAVSKGGKSRNWYSLTSDWLRRWREIFWPITNNRAITDYFQYLIESRSGYWNLNLLILFIEFWNCFNYLQVFQELNNFNGILEVVSALLIHRQFSDYSTLLR